MSDYTGRSLGGRNREPFSARCPRQCKFTAVTATLTSVNAVLTRYILINRNIDEMLLRWIKKLIARVMSSLTFGGYDKAEYCPVLGTCPA